MKTTKIHVYTEDGTIRLDIFASEKTGITRSQVQKLIRDGLVMINGVTASPGNKVKTSDVIEISMPEKSGEFLTPEDIPLKIIFMDEYIAVVDKPAGMVVYPAAGHSGGTLMNALAHYSSKLASIGGKLRPGVVHRLDKDTSGVMVVAVNDGSYYNLIEQFRNRTIQRKYVALVAGSLKEDSGDISLSIGRSQTDRKKMSTRTRRGKKAMTHWRVLKRLNKATMIEAKLDTGRTHQIRVHFAAVGHPVLGDVTYGKKTDIDINGRKVHIPRQMLHAEKLEFVHPISGQIMRFSSPFPDDMKACIESLTSLPSS
ncbi:MAG TPA: RluA family pseudouridine synthase [Dissulfurispiraceae bacterium]|nr:RluA family pseudouridine synthase [Dissulfurispiraceae bacterium]